MIYLSQMLGKAVVDAAGERIGTISDLAIATGEVFPRVTAVAFKGPDKTPFMLSWRKFVKDFDADALTLTVVAGDLRFSYLQSDELLLSRDLLNKQIVDTQGLKVVRVNDLKLSDSHNSLRLLGAEVGVKGLLRAISPQTEKLVGRFLALFNQRLPETLIAWNYMDLLERDLSQVKLSVTHKRLHELHPADVADILEQLGPTQRAAVFAHLDNEQAAETISELEDEFQADVIDDLSERRASDLLAEMDPDDAADIIGDLDYDKAERLLRLMGVEDSKAIRGLLGYREKTAGGIMTPEVITASEQMSVQDTIDHIREVAEERESVHYVYVIDIDEKLIGVVSLRDLLLAKVQTTLTDLMVRDIFVANPDDDQEDVAEMISKYDLLAIPVVDDGNKLLGIVTIDDALDVLEQEAEEDLARATGRTEHKESTSPFGWILPRRSGWIFIWLFAALAVAVGDAAFVTAIDKGVVIPDWVDTGLTLAMFVSIVLPLSLLIIEGATLRGIEALTDLAPEQRPSTMKRFLFGGAVGLLGGLLAGILGFTLIDLRTAGTGVQISFYFALLILAASVVCALVNTALIGRAVLLDDQAIPVSPTSISTFVMLLFTVSILAGSFALAYAGLAEVIPALRIVG